MWHGQIRNHHDKTFDAFDVSGEWVRSGWKVHISRSDPCRNWTLEWPWHVLHLKTEWPLTDRPQYWWGIRCWDWVGAGWVLKKMLVKNLYCHRKWNMKRFSHARHLNNNAKPSPSYESLKRRGEVVWLVCASGIYWTSSMLLINSYVTHSIIGLIHKSYWVSRVNKC